tara:strand:- start:200 stop:646 length:447 start_codon:yes stop_codon:yes gene_type:complete
MADRTLGTKLTNTNQVADFDLNALDASGSPVQSDPGAAFLSGMRAGMPRIQKYSFTPGTTLDNSGDVIADGDEVLLNVGFEPCIVILNIENTAREVYQFYVSALGFKFVAGAGSEPTASTSISWTGGVVTINNAATVNAKAHTVVCIG